MSTGIDSPAVLDALERSARDDRRRVLFTGGTVVTMDPRLGDRGRVDVLVEGARIAGVGADLRAQGAGEGAIVVNATGCIVSPGLVDTHRHAWQAQTRRTIPDVDDLGRARAAASLRCTAISPS